MSGTIQMKRESKKLNLTPTPRSTACRITASEASTAAPSYSTSAAAAAPSTRAPFSCGAAPYPHLPLGDFGNGTLTPRDESHALARVTLLYRRPAEAPLQDLCGRIDMWFIGSADKFVARP
jgi:hypothetical protein